MPAMSLLTAAARPVLTFAAGLACAFGALSAVSAASAPADGPAPMSAPAARQDSVQKPLAAADGHSSRDVLDWEGTYRGTLPCADCDGIKTTITLRGDGSYSQTSIYVGRGARFSETGRYTWNRAGSRITLTGKDHDPSLFIVGENHLEMLNQDGSPVTGPLANDYRLDKVS
ncbi:copper resistance protein NlpE [Amphibiibacter pelophylacis]|uniref:Copper resistance protein NlpE n=1 Tax=Amphibiibacter pelophylacis TaxID=1799477 RepID=A0ACC6NZY8_9BURK